MEPLHIWLAYVNYPITTAAYLLRALQTRCHVTTIGPRLPAELIEAWGLQNMNLPITTLDIDTSFTPDMAQIIADTPAADLPDLYIWVESVGGHMPYNLDALRCPKVCYLIDTHYHFEQSSVIASLFDQVFIAQLVDLEAMRKVHPRVHWLPLACDPVIHAGTVTEKLWDIGFVGSMNKRRENLLHQLDAHFNVHQERSFWHDMARTFSASRIVLNDASFDDLNMRFFEALASGSLLLSNMANGSGQEILFRDGADYACHYGYDLLTLAQYYLNNESLREEIAAEGQRRVLAAHTYRHRVDDLLDVLLRGKPDTFSAEELRERSEKNYSYQALASAGTPTATAVPVIDGSDRIVIQSVITARATKKWPTWQMIHEWEDYLTVSLGARFKPLSPACMVADPFYREGMYDIVYLPISDMLRYYEKNRQILPIVMDLWQKDFEQFERLASNFRLIFLTSLQVFRVMRDRGLSNIRYLPFALADKYLDYPAAEKTIDIVQFGRRDKLLESYMEQLLKRHPHLHYLTTVTEDDTVYFFSNQQGRLQESDSRESFMKMLSRCKISLVHSPGMDEQGTSGEIMPVSPRYLESIAAGCHLVGRIPRHDEFDLLGIRPFCHHADDYETFEHTVLTLLSGQPPSGKERHELLCRHACSVRAGQLHTLLYDAQLNEQLPLQREADMYRVTPRAFTSLMIKALRNSWLTLSKPARMDMCQTLCSVIGFYDEFWQIDLFDLFGEIISLQETPSDILMYGALELKYRGNLTGARQMANRARELDPESSFAATLNADLLREEGATQASRAASLTMLQTWPNNEMADAIMTMCDVMDQMLAMEHYHVLRHAHTMLNPRTYLEIGVSSGKSLSMSGADTVAIGVDPLTGVQDQQLFISPVCVPHLFKLTSNDFFAQGHLGRLFPKGKLDMAFIDGLHLFEQALMDFVNLEQYATENSVIFIHDCLPVNAAVATRKRDTLVWTGDVWKMIPCLKTLRPDLEIITLPVSPSGLALVRKLDPASRLLATQFDSIVAHFMDMQLPDSLDEKRQLLNVTNIDPYTVLKEIYDKQGAYQKAEVSG